MVVEGNFLPIGDTEQIFPRSARCNEEGPMWAAAEWVKLDHRKDLLPEFGLPYSRLSHEAGLLVSHSRPTPLFPQAPVKKTNTHCLEQYSGLNWESRMVVRQRTSSNSSSP